MANTLVPFGSRSMFHDFRKEMDDLMENFFGNGERGEAGQAPVWAPRLNMSESADKFEISVELPGMKPEDVDVELRRGDLWITGTRHSEKKEEGKTWHRVEHQYGQFRRVIRLGDEVDAEHIDAEYKDGVLHVTVPKAEKVQPKKIEIKR